MNTMESVSSTMGTRKATGLLKVINGPKVGKLYELNGSEVVIGRVPSVDIQIKGPSVSRNHCKLLWSSAVWSVVDLKSQNGTYMNDERVSSSLPTPLNHKDVIYLGPPTESPEALRFFACNSLEDNILVHPSKSVSHGAKSRSRRVKQDFSTEDRQSGESSACASRKRRYSEKENLCNTEPRSKKVALYAITESCSDNTVQNTEYSENRVDHMLSDFKLLDSSTSSIESLNTRIVKSCPKNKKQENVANLNIDSELSSKSAMSLNQNAEGNSSNTNSGDNQQIGVKCNLNEVFIEDDISQSLLSIESGILMGSDPYPFSQPLDDHANEQNNKSLASDHTKELVVSQNSTELILREQLKLLQEKVKKLEETHSELEKEVAQKDALLDECRIKEKKRDDDIQAHEHILKDEINSQVMKRIEEELMCNICTELLIKATVLECSHTFCEHCIYEWKKKKKQCPICRAKITTEVKVLILDHFIDKILDFVNPEVKEKRKEILDKREEAKKKDTKRHPKARRRRHARSPIRETIPVIAPPDENDVLSLSFDHIFNLLSHGMMEDVEGGSVEDEDSTPVEGYGYYPGHGRCFNCGRTGHWANGCPENI